jgi:hypothetical protein
MKNQILLLLMIFTLSVSAQDYTMYETHTLTPKAGHQKELNAAIANHNKLFHAEGPYKNYMFSIINGPRSGDILFAMGSCTFTQMDNRPSSAAHNKDWDNVLMHCDGGAKNLEYWKLDKDLSYMPGGDDGSTKGICKVRYFDVSDNSDFREMQMRFRKVDEAIGSTIPLIMYRNNFQNKEGRDWAAVTWYENWAAMDSFKWDGWKEKYIELYGEDGWEKLDNVYDKIILSREDELRNRRLDLQAPSK